VYDSYRFIRGHLLPTPQTPLYVVYFYVGAGGCAVVVGWRVCWMVGMASACLSMASACLSMASACRPCHAPACICSTNVPRMFHECSTIVPRMFHAASAFYYGTDWRGSRAAGGLCGLVNRRGAAIACKRQLLGSLRTKTVRSNAGNRLAQSPIFAYLSRLQARLRY
jgi:hypothetical protein